MTIAPSESWTIAPVNLNEAGVGKMLAQRRSVGKAGGILGSKQQDRQESEWNCNQPTNQTNLIIALDDTAVGLYLNTIISITVPSDCHCLDSALIAFHSALTVNPFSSTARAVGFFGVLLLYD